MDQSHEEKITCTRGAVESGGGGAQKVGWGTGRVKRGAFGKPRGCGEHQKKGLNTSLGGGAGQREIFTGQNLKKREGLFTKKPRPSQRPTKPKKIRWLLAGPFWGNSCGGSPNRVRLYQQTRRKITKRGGPAAKNLRGTERKKRWVGGKGDLQACGLTHDSRQKVT